MVTKTQTEGCMELIMEGHSQSIGTQQEENQGNNYLNFTFLPPFDLLLMSPIGRI